MDHKKPYCLGCISILVLLGLFSGCSQPMRTLMELDSEQKSQCAQVEAQRARFEVLLRDAKNKRLKLGSRRASIVSRYGLPVLEQDNVLFYRDPVDFFNSDKVYLTINALGALTDIRIEKKDGK